MIVLCLLLSDLEDEGFLLAVPLVVSLLWQAAWSVELSIVVFVEGKSACSFMTGSYFGEARGGSENIYVWYYIIVSFASLIAIGLSHYRYCRRRAAAAQE